MPYVRPKGFTVDAALPDGGREEYNGEGRELAGQASPVRLLVGASALTHGEPCSWSPRLHALVREDQLLICNKGPHKDFPGFLICPRCGRALDPDDPGPHTYPADVPPHRGPKRGPRAGTPCPHRENGTNQVVLAHTFHSEVLLLGVDLPPELDAPVTTPAGRAVWYSFGTLVVNAATKVLQIDPGELRVGVRPARRAPGRIHGEVFIVDDVPGGAGYARAIHAQLEEVLHLALALGQGCSNPSCGGACYECVLDYRNQQLHPLLDRALGTSLLEFLLEGKVPRLTPEEAYRAAQSLARYAADWETLPGFELGGRCFPYVLARGHARAAVCPVHPLDAGPSEAERWRVTARHRARCAPFTTFDLLRRPFWALNHLEA